VVAVQVVAVQVVAVDAVVGDLYAAMWMAYRDREK
jgi:hypothetical protein